MALKKDGLKQIALRLDRLKKLPDVLDEELKAVAFDMRRTAVAMAPIDYGGLRAAIKVRRTAATIKGIRGFVRGKSIYSVYIDNSSPAPGRKEANVGEYAWYIHTHMGWAGHSAPLMPSAKSIASGNGQDPVGGRFMDRAGAKFRGQCGFKLKKKTSEFIREID